MNIEMLMLIFDDSLINEDLEKKRELVVATYGSKVCVSCEYIILTTSRATKTSMVIFEDDNYNSLLRVV